MSLQEVQDDLRAQFPAVPLDEWRAACQRYFDDYTAKMARGEDAGPPVHW